MKGTTSRHRPSWRNLRHSGFRHAKPKRKVENPPAPSAHPYPRVHPVTGDGRKPPTTGTIQNFSWITNPLEGAVFELALRWAVSQGATLNHMVQAVNESEGEDWQGRSKKERDVYRQRAVVVASDELSRIRGLAEWAASENLDGVQRKPIAMFGLISPHYVALNLDGTEAIVLCAIAVKL